MMPKSVQKVAYGEDFCTLERCMLMSSIVGNGTGFDSLVQLPGVEADVGLSCWLIDFNY